MKKMLVFLIANFLVTSISFGVEDYWVKPMTEIHKKFKGEKGSVATYGDSITYAKPFWSTIRNGVKNCEDIDIMELVDYITVDSWDLKGPENGNYSGWTINNGLKGIDEWLKKHNPEVVIVMFGTNDVGGGSPSQTGYEENLKKFVQKCLDNGSIVMLTTIPPRRGFLEGVKQYNESIKRVAKEKKVPVIEYYEEIMKLAPNNWDGTIISNDGVHPSWEDNDFSKEGLKKSGYGLRNYVTLKKYEEVYKKILNK